MNLREYKVPGNKKCFALCMWRKELDFIWMLSAHEDGEKITPCGGFNSIGTTSQCFNYSVLMTPQIPTQSHVWGSEMDLGEGGYTGSLSLETLHGYHWLRKEGTQEVLDGACHIHEYVHFISSLVSLKSCNLIGWFE